MAVTHEELASFHVFAEQMLAHGGAASIEELARAWQSVRERADVNAALQEATADLEAGRHRPADHGSRDIRQKYNLPAR